MLGCHKLKSPPEVPNRTATVQTLQPFQSDIPFSNTKKRHRKPCSFNEFLCARVVSGSRALIFAQGRYHFSISAPSSDYARRTMMVACKFKYAEDLSQNVIFDFLSNFIYYSIASSHDGTFRHYILNYAHV